MIFFNNGLREENEPAPEKDIEGRIECFKRLRRLTITESSCRRHRVVVSSSYCRCHRVSVAIIDIYHNQWLPKPPITVGAVLLAIFGGLDLEQIVALIVILHDFRRQTNVIFQHLRKEKIDEIRMTSFWLKRTVSMPSHDGTKPGHFETYNHSLSHELESD